MINYTFLLYKNKVYNSKVFFFRTIESLKSKQLRTSLMNFPKIYLML